MASLLHYLACCIVRYLGQRVAPAWQAAGLISMVLVTLSSCSRAAYVFSPSQPAYLASERPAPSVPVPAAFQAAISTDLLPAASGRRPQRRGRRPARRTYPATAPPTGPSLQARPLIFKIATKRLVKLATRRPPRSTAGLGWGISPFGSLGAGISLMVGGLVAVLIGISLSTNIIGAIFGSFFIVAGSVLLAAGLIVLLIALIAKA